VSPHAQSETTYGLHVLVILRLVTVFLQAMQVRHLNWFTLRLLDATVNTGGERTYIQTPLMIGKADIGSLCLLEVAFPPRNMNEVLMCWRW
jgi:hypothetical protein